MAICVFAGPKWVYEFVNPRYPALFPGRQLLGRRLVEALPEVATQPLPQLLRRVYDAGEPCYYRHWLTTDDTWVNFLRQVFTLYGGAAGYINCKPR